MIDVPFCTYFLSYAVSDTIGSNTMVIGNVTSCFSGVYNIGPTYCVGSTAVVVLESAGKGIWIAASATG